MRLHKLLLPLFAVVALVCTIPTFGPTVSLADSPCVNYTASPYPVPTTPAGTAGPMICVNGVLQTSGSGGGGGSSNVVVTNTPGVTVQNTPSVIIASPVGAHGGVGIEGVAGGTNVNVNCASGCSSGGAPAYSTCKITTTSVTVCKASAATFIGVANIASSAQTTIITCYDNASAASGTVWAVIAALGATQIITWPAPGKGPTTNGLTCQGTAAIVGTDVDIYYV